MPTMESEHETACFATRTAEHLCSACENRTENDDESEPGDGSNTDPF
jgi:hypothetical protein